MIFTIAYTHSPWTSFMCTTWKDRHARISSGTKNWSTHWEFQIFSIGYRAEKSTENMDMIDSHQFRLRTILIEKCMVTATSKKFWRFCIKAAPRKCLVLIFMLYKWRFLVNNQKNTFKQLFFLTFQVFIILIFSKLCYMYNILFVYTLHILCLRLSFPNPYFHSLHVF